MTWQENDTAVSSGRGLVTKALPDVPAGLAPSGPIVPGVYAGITVHTSDQAISVRLRLYLYADGGVPGWQHLLPVRMQRGRQTRQHRRQNAKGRPAAAPAR